MKRFELFREAVEPKCLSLSLASSGIFASDVKRMCEIWWSLRWTGWTFITWCLGVQVASLLLVVRPGAPSSILAPSSDARSPL